VSDTLQTASDDLLTEPQFWSKPHSDRMASYARLRAESPVSWHPENVSDWLPEGGRGFWAVTRYADIVSISKDFKNFSSAQGTNPMDEPGRPVETLGMLHMDPPQHRRFRRIVNPAFTGDLLESLTPTIEKTADEVLDIFADSAELDIVQPLIHNYTISVICNILGLPQSERGAFLAATMKAFGPDREAAIAGHNFMIDYVKTLAVERRANPGEDVLSRVATAQVEGEMLSDTDVAYFVALLLGAGAETSASTIMQGMWNLFQNPDQLAAVRDDLDRLPKAVEEMLRIGSAVICFRRSATTDITIENADIKEGDKVVLFYESGNNDETVFSTPGTFDIARDPNQHVSFGGYGPHLCLGAPLARKEINTFYRKFLTRFSEFEILQPPTFAPNQRFNIVTSMPVRLTQS